MAPAAAGRGAASWMRTATSKARGPAQRGVAGGRVRDGGACGRVPTEPAAAHRPAPVRRAIGGRAWSGPTPDRGLPRQPSRHQRDALASSQSRASTPAPSHQRGTRHGRTEGPFLQDRAPSAQGAEHRDRPRDRPKGRHPCDHRTHLPGRQPGHRQAGRLGGRGTIRAISQLRCHGGPRGRPARGGTHPARRRGQARRSCRPARRPSPSTSVPTRACRATYAAIEAWIASTGHTASGGPWEIYLTDPSQEPDPSRWLTEVIYPLQRP